MDSIVKKYSSEFNRLYTLIDSNDLAIYSTLHFLRLNYSFKESYKTGRDRILFVEIAKALYNLSMKLGVSLPEIQSNSGLLLENIDVSPVTCLEVVDYYMGWYGYDS